MNKNIITAVVVGLLVVVGLIFWMTQKPEGSVNNKSGGEPVVTDSTTSINQSLVGVDVGDLDKEFQQIDIDLKTL